MAGEWSRAASAAKAVAGDGTKTTFVLDQLELGAAQLAASEVDGSAEAFAQAWSRMSELGGPDNRKTIDALAAVALNDRVMPYLGMSYDRVMCCTYQALLALSVSDQETARVMLKRAQFAQEDAERRFSKQISKASEKIASEYEDVRRAEASAEFQQGYEEVYGTLEDRFSPYEGWTNPFTDWLTAIVLLGLDETASDRNRAIDLLRRVRGTIGSNENVDSDIALAQTNSVSGYVWVVVESGMAPMRVERRFEIPAFVLEMPYIGLALPELVDVPGGIRSFTVQGEPSSVVCDLGSIISHEFAARLPLITRRAIASTFFKAAATLAANLAAKESGKEWAEILSILGTNIYGQLTLAADLRTWRTLPRQILIARSPIPPDRRIRLGGLGELKTVDLIDGDVLLVHVRSVEASGPTAIFQAALGSTP